MRISHSLFELSFEQLNSSIPFEANSTLVTSPKCEEIVLIHNPEITSQNLMEQSFEPLIIRFPSGLKIVRETDR